MTADFPQAEMFKDFLDDQRIFDERYDAHRSLAFWAYQGVYLVDFFD
jgi:hypothetical protein